MNVLCRQYNVRQKQELKAVVKRWEIRNDLIKIGGLG